MTVLKRRCTSNSGADAGFSVGGGDLLAGQKIIWGRGGGDA